MEYLECKPSSKKKTPAYQEVETLLASSTREDTFVAAWLLKTGASVKLTAGFEDDGTQSSLCIIPRLNEENVAEVYLDISQVKQGHPEVRAITAYARGVSQGYSDLDDEVLEKQQRSMGMTYSDDLCERIGSFEAIYHWALSYALSDGGEALLEPADLDVVFDSEEPEDSSLLDQPLYVCGLHYQSPKVRGGVCAGFGESMYFRMNVS